MAIERIRSCGDTYGGNHRRVGPSEWASGVLRFGNGRIDDPKEYGRAMQALPFGCVDVVLERPDGRVAVLLRNVLPQSGPWVGGGRKRGGETDLEALTRLLQGEFKLTLDDVRGEVHRLFDYGMHWADSAQGPSCSPTSFCYHVLLTEEAARRLSGVDSEYDGLVWVHPRVVARNITGTFHPTHVQMVKDLLRKRWVRRLSFGRLHDVVTRRRMPPLY